MSNHRDIRVTSKLYYYAAYVTDVYDGDTITVNIDLGMGIWRNGQTIRLWKVDTPEVRGATRAEGLRVRDMVRDLVLEQSVLVRTILDKRGTDRVGKYGRLLGEILVPNKRGALINVNDLLLGLGMAVPMGADGSRTRSLPPAGASAAALPDSVPCPFCGESREVFVAAPDEHTSEHEHGQETLSQEPDATETALIATDSAVVAYESIYMAQCPNCLDKARPLYP